MQTDDERGAPHTPPPAEAERLGGALFLRLLGLTHLLCFASLWPQLPGLLGRRGMLPVGELLEAARRALPLGERLARVPSLLWLGRGGDDGLLLLCAAGVGASLLLLGGAAQWLALPLLYGVYLSLVAVGRDFLAFQWDSLLLEATFLSMFLLRRDNALGRLLLRLLLFRLMFGSGCVKLLSRDEAWWGLRGLHYHFETQPLPNVLGYLAHQLPGWAKTATEVAMFVIELGVPWLVLLPSRWRRHAVLPLVLLQGGIALTGNYGYFSVLSAVLCLPLLPDAWLARWLPAWLRARLSGGAAAVEVEARAPWPRRALVAAPQWLCLLLGVRQLLGLFWPGCPPLALAEAAAPFHLGSRYGLFAVMTRERPEIIIEGSDDGERWQAFELPYKPGALDRRPPFVAPHQPRLDWQLWFAALGEARDNPWFGRLCLRLLEGSPEVRALLERDPFPGRAPRYLRALRYDYRFTDLATLRRTGQYWTRGEPSIYVPVVRLPEPP